MLLLSALVLTTDIWAIRKSLPTPYLTHTARRGKSKDSGNSSRNPSGILAPGGPGWVHLQGQGMAWDPESWSSRQHILSLFLFSAGKVIC